METPYQRIIFLVLISIGFTNAQEETLCYGPGSIAASVILTFLLTLLLIWAVYYWKTKRQSKTEHLILETDPEKGKGQYAFDNPGFKEATFVSNNKGVETPLDRNKSKWTQWSPLSVLSVKSEKPEKKRSMDDLALGEKEVKVISLRSEDFTGLGFNICGNMREGIYVKDVLHRGPAFDSGKLNSGDRINSVTINFEHMVYDDALSILSYASPYEVVIEAKGGKLIHNIPGQGGQPGHPLYKSSSHLDLHYVEKTKKKFNDNDSNYSSLKKSISNMTTLERKESKSPRSNITPKKPNNLNPDQLKYQLEQKIDDHLNMKDTPTELETQKTENKFTKFGIKVLPFQISPKSSEQNDNNINIEKNFERPLSIDEVDNTKKLLAPPVKKREKKVEKQEPFERNGLNGSGLKRDKEGIPLELPDEMLQSVTAVMNNRKSAIRDSVHTTEDDPKVIKRKSKAPPAPEEAKVTNYDEIQPAKEEESVKEDAVEVIAIAAQKDKEVKCYNSDSDVETDNNSSVNTIELNSSDITIHQTEDEERQNRKTVSTGDLSKIKGSKSPNTGTLERAQSLDISDSTIPTLSRKRKVARNDEDIMKSDEDLFRSEVLDKEPRLSLILDGLNTFQRNRLKKSTEWGNLEDAIMKLNNEEESLESSIEADTNKFTAVVNKINEIKRESEETLVDPYISKKVKNEIWPEIDQSSGEALNIQPSKSLEALDNLANFNQHADEERFDKESFDIEPPITPVVQKNKVYNRINEPFEQTDTLEVAPSIIIPERNRRQRVPDIKAEPLPVPPEQLLEDEWDVNNITNTSPPLSLETEETIPSRPSPVPKPEEVLSKIPLLNSMVKNQKEEALRQTVLSSNITDETKTVVNLNVSPVELDLKEVTQNFLFTEQLNNESVDPYTKSYDVNVSDDIKVSRHSYESLEKQIPKSDDAKSNVKHVSNVSVINSSNGDSELHSLEFTINDSEDLYTTALDNEINDSKLLLTTPDLIKNVTLTEAINTLNNEVTFTNQDSSNSQNLDEDTINSFSEENKKPNSSHTYITEIKVTPTKSNVSEIEIKPDETAEEKEEGEQERNLDKDFENYVKSFEAKLEHFENNIHQFDKNLEEFIKDESIEEVKTNEIVDEKELHEIQKKAEQQLKKLPEMKFTTSSYESSKITEKRHSHVEQLKSNFEKSPSKQAKPDSSTKSRIPIATTAKTPPTSPERRDSRNLENENDKAILELMSSSITSTPIATKMKPPNKNITVTSIRTSSKIPSGLPTLGGTRTPRKIDLTDDNVVQVSTNGNGNLESSFKQWVFNPSNVTNVTVTQSKEDKK